MDVVLVYGARCAEIVRVLCGCLVCGASGAGVQCPACSVLLPYWYWVARTPSWRFGGAAAEASSLGPGVA